MSNRVSVIIPTFNRANLLSEAIESVLCQTHSVFEIVVVDDGSTDNTKQVCDRYPTVKYIYQENRGIAGARNTGIQASQGEYLLFLDSDDRLLPNAVEVGSHYLDRHPEVGFVFGRFTFLVIQPDGSYQVEEVFSCADQPPVADYGTLLSHEHNIQLACVLFRRVTVESVGGFDARFEPMEDQNFILRIAREFLVYYHDQVVSEYRYNGSNVSRDAARLLLISRLLCDAERDYIQQSHKIDYLTAYEQARTYWLKLLLERLPYEVMRYVQAGNWVAAIGILRLILHYDPKLGWVDQKVYASAYRATLSHLRQRQLYASLDYWQQNLAGAPALFSIPTDRPRPATQTFRGHTQSFTVPPAVTSALNELSQQHRAPLSTALLAAFDVLLYRYTRTEDIIVGVPDISNPEGEPFVNSVVLRTDLSGEPTFQDLLDRVKAVSVAAQPHQSLPFEILVEELQSQQDASYSPLFQVLFAWEEDLSFQAVDLSRLTASPWVITENTAKCDLTLLLKPTDHGLEGKWVYNADLFEAATIERLVGHFQTLLEAIVTHPDQSIATLPLLTPAEQHQLLVEWNSTQVEYPKDKCIHELIEAQVERTPDAIAVTFEDQHLTYQDLNQRANQLAHYLQSLGIGAESLVGICVDRSLEMVIGLIAILKAGGAYVPIDPAYPRDRISYTLQDANVSVLLTQTHLADVLPTRDRTTIYLDRLNETIAQQPINNPSSNVTANNLAYVIYTSGSTGKPKGVLIPHRNIIRLMTATQAWYHFNDQDVWTLFHSYAFDFSVWELWGALVYGGRVVVVPYFVSRSPADFYQLLCREQVTVLNQTPSAFCQLIQAESSIQTTQPLKLRWVIFGGEALELQSLKPWFDRHGDRCPQLVNMYGITETTVHVTYRPITLADLDQPASLIGRPIPDLQLYVLDSHRNPVPIGVSGELYVGGAGVARGYLNRADLNAERFIENPFSATSESRLYKTGDLVRYLPDGDLEYLGRIDQQVKIRGFRIELGEIETALNQHPAVLQAVVIAREDEPGDKRLVAYVIADRTQPLTSSDFRQFLQQTLPDYMIPAAFVHLDTLPLTPNGKIDRRALPKPETANLYPSAAYTDALSTTTDQSLDSLSPVEQELLQIWQQVLRREQLGVHDNFFELGGHSLLAIQIITRIRDAMQVELPLHQLFEAPTISEMAMRIIQLQLSDLSEAELEQMLAEMEC